MAGTSKIEWTESTWNPVVGCSIVSPGCTNCYAMRDAWRKHHNPALPHYHGLTKLVKGNPVWTGEVRQAPEHILLKPLKTRKPTVWFVNSMSDLFHESIPDEWIDRVFAVMALCPQHTFQVLTKRAERMRDYVSETFSGLTGPRMYALADVIRALAGSETEGTIAVGRIVMGPLLNCWLGVSAERQQEADERIPHLLQTPAAIRFVSLEPLLGPIDLTNHDPTGIQKKMKAHGWSSIWKGNAIGRAWLDWVIVGGESGPQARPMHPDWVRSLQKQCEAAGIAYFFKQWGEYHPSDQHDPALCKIGRTPEAIHVSGKREFRPGEQFALIGGRTPGWAGMCRLGKKAAGRLLDGREWNQMPEVRP